MTTALTILLAALATAQGEPGAARREKAAPAAREQGSRKATADRAKAKKPPAGPRLVPDAMYSWTGRDGSTHFTPGYAVPADRAASATPVSAAVGSVEAIPSGGAEGSTTTAPAAPGAQGAPQAGAPAQPGAASQPAGSAAPAQPSAAPAQPPAAAPPAAAPAR
jgi:hypothetical protein